MLQTKRLEAMAQLYLPVLIEAGGEYPFTITVTFVGVRGLTAPRENFDLGPKVPFPRDVVFLPDVVLESADGDLPATLRATFDALWQSLGYERSRNYEADGTWKGKLA